MWKMFFKLQCHWLVVNVENVLHNKKTCTCLVLFLFSISHMPQVKHHISVLDVWWPHMETLRLGESAELSDESPRWAQHLHHFKIPSSVLRDRARSNARKSWSAAWTNALYRADQGWSSKKRHSTTAGTECECECFWALAHKFTTRLTADLLQQGWSV